MKHQISSKLLLACILSAVMLTACGQQTPNVSDSGSGASDPQASVEFNPEDNIQLEGEVVILNTPKNPKVTMEYEPLPSDGEVEGSTPFLGFLVNFLKSTQDNPAETKCSPEVQELMKASPNAAQDLNVKTPIYIQTQAQMENMHFIRFAYDTESGTTSDLFTFEMVDGNLILQEPDKLASFVSGGVYEVVK